MASICTKEWHPNFVTIKAILILINATFMFKYYEQYTILFLAVLVIPFSESRPMRLYLLTHQRTVWKCHRTAIEEKHQFSELYVYIFWLSIWTIIWCSTMWELDIFHHHRWHIAIIHQHIEVRDHNDPPRGKSLVFCLHRVIKAERQHHSLSLLLPIGPYCILHTQSNFHRQMKDERSILLYLYQ